MARSDQGSERSEGLSRALTPQRIGVIVLLAAFAVWCFANADEVTVDFVVVDAEVRLFVALLLAGVIGAAVGYLAARRRAD